MGQRSGRKKTTRKKAGMAQSEEHSMQPWKTVIDRSTRGDSQSPAQSLGGPSPSGRRPDPVEQQLGCGLLLLSGHEDLKKPDYDHTKAIGIRKK